MVDLYNRFYYTWILAYNIHFNKSKITNGFKKLIKYFDTHTPCTVPRQTLTLRKTGAPTDRQSPSQSTCAERKERRTTCSDKENI